MSYFYCSVHFQEFPGISYCPKCSPETEKAHRRIIESVPLTKPIQSAPAPDSKRGLDHDEKTFVHLNAGDHAEDEKIYTRREAEALCAITLAASKHKPAPTAPDSEAASNWQLAQKLAKEKFLLDFMKFLGLDEYIEEKIKEHTEAYHD